MKLLRAFLILALGFSVLVPSSAQPGGAPAKESDLTYFLPEGEYHFDKDIPTPFQVLGFNIGERYVDWGDVLRYMEVLAAKSDRVSLKRFGSTYQGRDFIQVCITSAENQKHLAEIRDAHLKLTDPQQCARMDISQMPVVVDLMASIHGNEASGVNAAMVAAYYFAASTDIDQLLSNTVVLVTPGLNPDGIHRFAGWVNATVSRNNVADLNSREFSEPWPSSRTNHYWADCNRDWLTVQHPEGRNCVAMYLEWMPNVVLDMHEQAGSFYGFYFSPGDARRTYEHIPQRNQDLTFAIGSNTAAAFDKKGIFYYSKESYDDFFIGKGAAYGDVKGSVCILHEQLASYGHLRPTAWGPMSFASTVRNQAVAAVSVATSAFQMRCELLDYQKNFYLDQKKASKADAVKGYEFNTAGDKGRAYHFIDNMLVHGIEVYQSSKDSSSYVIPLDNKNYYTIKAIMDPITEFADSTFYDISTWTLPYAYDLNFKQVKNLDLGRRVERAEFVPGSVDGGLTTVAYAFEMKEYYAPYMLSELLKDGVLARVANKSFLYNYAGTQKKFSAGTVIVPVINQRLTSQQLYEKLCSLAKASGVEVVSLKTGFMEDHDLGARSFKPVKPKNVVIVTGGGMSVSESGEVWNLLDRRFAFNHALVNYDEIYSKKDLASYNVMVMCNGEPYNLVPSGCYKAISSWVKDGGTLIVTGSAVSIANEAKLTDISVSSGKKVKGLILDAKLDMSSPLSWGYTDSSLPLFKMKATVYESETGDVPVKYKEHPYLSGCVSAGNLDRIAGSPAVIVKEVGKGKVVFFADDLNFRSYWYGASKMFLNAILFADYL